MKMPFLPAPSVSTALWSFIFAADRTCALQALAQNLSALPPRVDQVPSSFGSAGVCDERDEHHTAAGRAESIARHQWSRPLVSYQTLVHASVLLLARGTNSSDACAFRHRRGRARRVPGCIIICIAHVLRSLHASAGRQAFSDVSQPTVSAFGILRRRPVWCQRCAVNSRIG